MIVTPLMHMEQLESMGRLIAYYAKDTLLAMSELYNPSVPWSDEPLDHRAIAEAKERMIDELPEDLNKALEIDAISYAHVAAIGLPKDRREDIDYLDIVSNVVSAYKSWNLSSLQLHRLRRIESICRAYVRKLPPPRTDRRASSACEAASIERD